MPQHWVGRAAVVTTLVMAAALVQPGSSVASTHSEAYASAHGVGFAQGARTEPAAVDLASGSGLDGQLALERASQSAALSLPWRDGHAWRLSGGPHNNYGRRAHPWSSLDFGGPVAGASTKVRAARGGVVRRPCANLVEIRHDATWTTSYYHLKNITVRAGQRVERGTLLGYTSTATGCGGYASGPHVHFSVLRNGQHVNLDGFSIGGWTVREGKGQYYGCMVRAGTRKCAPSGRVQNTGAIGTD